MDKELITQIESFRAQADLSEYRVGFILARNGRLFERLRQNKRIWPETVELIRRNLAAETAKRNLSGAV